jgi:streptogramin lyase
VSAIDYRPTTFLARVLGITPGQAATLVVALVVALVLTLGALPPVLRQRGADRTATTANRAPEATAPATGSTPEAPDTRPAASVAAPLLGIPSFSRSTSSGGSGTRESSSSSSQSARGVLRPATGEVAEFARVPSPGAPYGLAVDADGTVYVGTDNGSSRGEQGASRILSFSADGSSVGSITITGQPDDHALGITGLAFERAGLLTVLDAATSRILRIDVASGRQTELATLVDLAACPLVVAAQTGCEPGLENDQPIPQGLAYDPSGTLYITDAAQGTIWRLRRGGKLEPWLGANQFAGADGLAAIVVERSGSLLVASTQAMDPASLGGGAVYRVPVNSDGTAGDPTLVAGFDGGENPTGLAPLPDGSIAVSVETAVVLISVDGAEIRRVSSDALSRPSGLAFLGDALLAAITGAPSTTDKWAVLAVGIN